MRTISQRRWQGAALAAAAACALAAPPAAGEVRIERRVDGSRVVRNVAAGAAAAAAAAPTGERPSAQRPTLRIERSPSAAVSPAAPPADLRRVVAEAAAGEGIDARLVEAVVRAESAWNPRAVSRKGAIGLMQLMPATAAELAVDPWDAAANARGGVRYLRHLLDRFGRLEHALAAYNAGPGAVERHGGVPPYAETRAYVRRVLALYDGREADLGAPLAAGGPAPRLVQTADGRRVLTNQPATALGAAAPAPPPEPAAGGASAPTAGTLLAAVR
jgi:soluble lytic murein transglycosylase-like protein